MAETMKPPVGTAFEESCSKLAKCQTLPGLVVFALDYVLWPYQCDYSLGLEDTEGVPSAYVDAPGVLAALQAKGIKVACVYRHSQEHLEKAQDFLKALTLKEGLSFTELPHDGSISDQLRALKARTGLPFSRMLFFEADACTAATTARLGIATQRVRMGINVRELAAGLDLLAAQQLEQSGF